ncbi:MAG: hypothetical protein PHO91_02165 [Patescibacteria group bacterium]|nr:hypothetical protein [Patescibacteria group bacterium]
MEISQKKIVYFFRYLWLAVFTVLLIWILSQSLVLGRNLTYQLDFRHDLSRDIFGWYPQSRVEFINGQILVLGEPLYLDVYLPTKFKTMIVNGSFEMEMTEVRLGLRQKDGSWDFREIESSDFEISFDLTNAQLKRNSLQVILSLPALGSDDLSPVLKNNWQITFSR